MKSLFTNVTIKISALAILVLLNGTAQAENLVVLTVSSQTPLTTGSQTNFNPASHGALLGKYRILDLSCNDSVLRGIGNDELSFAFEQVAAVLPNHTLTSLAWAQNRVGLQPPPDSVVLKLDTGWLVDNNHHEFKQLARDDRWLVAALYDGFTLTEVRLKHDLDARRDIAEIVNQVSQIELMARIDELVAFGTRYARAANYRDSTLYLQDKLLDYGLAAELQPFEISGGIIVENVIATLPGITEPDTHILIGAHYDSTSPDPYNIAPGADDNGSGSAGVLEAARILSQYQFHKTIKFVLFAAEELGLRGSIYYVQQAQAQGEIIPYVVTMDMIGYAPEPNGYVVLLETSNIGIPLMDVLEATAYAYTDLGVARSLYPFGSDHVPFLNAGIPAVLVIENEWASNPNYHSVTDLPGYLNPEFITDVVRMNLAGIAELAGLAGTTPTPTAPPTATAYATATPEPTPLYANPEIELFINDELLSSYDLALLETVTTNYSTAPLIVSHFCALEAYGLYYFYPSWSAIIDYAPLTLAPSTQETQTILRFQLPQLLQPQGPFYFWALLTSAEDFVPLCPAVKVRFFLEP